MTEDAKKWEKTASGVDTMLPHLPETDCKHWKELAKEYRARANRCTSMRLNMPRKTTANEPKHESSHWMRQHPSRFINGAENWDYRPDPLS